MRLRLLVTHHRHSSEGIWSWRGSGDACELGRAVCRSNTTVPVTQTRLCIVYTMKRYVAVEGCFPFPSDEYSLVWAANIAPQGSNNGETML